MRAHPCAMTSSRLLGSLLRRAIVAITKSRDDLVMFMSTYHRYSDRCTLGFSRSDVPEIIA